MVNLSVMARLALQLCLLVLSAAQEDEIRMSRTGGRIPPGLAAKQAKQEAAVTAAGLAAKQVKQEAAVTAAGGIEPVVKPTHSLKELANYVDVEALAQPFEGKAGLAVAAFFFEALPAEVAAYKEVVKQQKTWLADAELGPLVAFGIGFDRSLGVAAGCPSEGNVHSCVLMVSAAQRATVCRLAD
jgi:hypothetical protein